MEKFYSKGQHMLSSSKINSLSFAMACLVCGCDRGASCAKNDTALPSESPYTLNVGNILEGTPIKHRFRIVNSSPITMRIKKLTGGCACEYHLVSSQPLPLSIDPGSYAEIEVDISTKEHSGHLEKKYIVVTDSEDPSMQTIVLSVSAEVMRPARAIPSKIQFGIVRPNSNRTKQLQVMIHEAEMLNTFRTFECSNPNVFVSLSRNQPSFLTFDVQLAEGLGHGDLAGSIALHFDYEDFRVLNIPLFGRIESDLKVIPQEIVLDHTTNSSGKMCVKSIADNRFSIVQAIAPEGMEVSLSNNDMHSNVHYFTVKGNASISVPHGSYITLKIEHPQQQELRIAVQ